MALKYSLRNRNSIIATYQQVKEGIVFEINQRFSTSHSSSTIKASKQELVKKTTIKP